MRTIHRFAVLAALLVSVPCQPVAGEAEGNAFERLLDRHAALNSSWPGFYPQDIPLALYDGSETQLFNHPQPPDEFVPRDGLHVHEGRHPAVRANSSTPIADTLTATILLSQRQASTDELLGLMAHEMFHVFQRQHHPDWSGNEAVAFTYPVDDEAVMATRIIEESGLALALAAETPEDAHCYAAIAMHSRGMRFALLADEHREYEQASELNEGLARYIQALYALTPPQDIMPDEPFAPDRLRWRFYETGAAMALLLDRFSPGWKEMLNGSLVYSLDELLTQAVDRDEDCRVSDSRYTDAIARARTMVAEYRERLAAMEKEFMAAPGIRLRIVADGTPLWPKGFDPLNVTRLPDGRVLHSRLLMLQNESGGFEMLGRAAVTRGVGDHPLFNGVDEVLFTGIDAGSVVVEGSRARMKHDELELDIAAARIERDDAEITIHIGGK